MHWLTVNEPSTWRSPIERLVPRTPEVHAITDAAWCGWGFVCYEYKFIAAIDTPPIIQKNTSKFKDTDATVSQNFLELAGVIMTYAAVQTFLATFRSDLQPLESTVLELWADIVTAISRIKKVKASSPQEIALLHIMGNFDKTATLI